MKTLSKEEVINEVQKELAPLYNKAKDSKYKYLMRIKKVRREDYKGKWQEIARVATKADLSLLDWGNEVILEKLTKKYNKMLEDISLKLSNKLEELNIEKIEYQKYSDKDLELTIKCSDKTRTLSINTVIAGGYNIQYLHYRTSIKLSE